MLKQQTDLFYLDKNVHYLNNAYMSPNLKAVEVAGISAIRMKSKPYKMAVHHFFEPVTELKSTFAELVNCPETERIAIIPSASYGLANVAYNLEIGDKKKIIIPSGTFPSNYYIWKRIADQKGLEIVLIDPPADSNRRGELWNQMILDAIDDETLLVACGHVHWSDGTLYDLKSFRKACDKYGSYLVIDGSQSLGALDFDIQEIRPDALITVGYKWLFGPYGIGFAYFNERFDNGVPIEENWINRFESEDFKNLVNYQEKYKPNANRYCVGENSQFVSVPMMHTALLQIKAWGIKNIQEYSRKLIQPYLQLFREMGCEIENETYRCNHLLGVRLPGHVDPEAISKSLKQSNVYVSVRGTAIRIATSVYNTSRDLDILCACLKNEINKVVSI